MPVTILVWNMGWMNDLFVSNGQAAAWRPDNETPQHSTGTTVRERRNHLSGVLNDLSPDLVVCISSSFVDGI